MHKVPEVGTGLPGPTTDHSYCVGLRLQLYSDVACRLYEVGSNLAMARLWKLISKVSRESRPKTTCAWENSFVSNRCWTCLIFLALVGAGNNNTSWYPVCHLTILAKLRRPRNQMCMSSCSRALMNKTVLYRESWARSSETPKWLTSKGKWGGVTGRKQRTIPG